MLDIDQLDDVENTMDDQCDETSSVAEQPNVAAEGLCLTGTLSASSYAYLQGRCRGRVNAFVQFMGTAAASVVSIGMNLAPGSSICSCASSSSTTCDKCDGDHVSERCPYFKGAREEHKDAWVNYGRDGNPHQMGSDGGNFVLRAARVVRQPGDGSCLFHSLNHGLSSSSLNGASSAEDLRCEIARFLEANPQLEIAGDTLEQWVKWDSSTPISDYVQRMETGAWGGGIEMAACSRLKEVNIHVYETSGFEYKRISCFNCGGAARTIHVLYQGRMHYDALIPA